MDINGTIRSNREEWLNSSCIKCACVNGSINCYQYDVNITYGMFKVQKIAICERCSEPTQMPETTSACRGKISLNLD